MSPKLSDIKPGTRIRVVGYERESQYAGQLRRLGLVPGTEITLTRRAPLGDPVEVRVRGYSLALRPSEAADLEFEVIGP